MLRFRSSLVIGAALTMALHGIYAMAATTSQIAGASSVPLTDERAAEPVQTLDTPRTFPVYNTLAEWQARRTYIRRQILIACGLNPMPKKTPLKAKVFGRIFRDGYTIEKVYFQTYPGFYLAGNLYRPIEIGDSGARHPAVLITHGHWDAGRMADGPSGSIPARAITFARQGYVAFTYDMVGYNDTRQITHRLWANDRRHWLWGVSELGLQTWNSIRALDFVSGLPDVDKTRLAITGESGGGTQTMILGAIDDRLAAVGPCVMVSHIMQGGCLCENAPGLRVDFSNMEIAACAAPKPQIMVGATGDWTKTMMTIEGPGVESIYKLYGKPENLKYVIFDYGHNINETSRNAVYAWFGAHLTNETKPDNFKEKPYRMEAVADLRVFPVGEPLPKDALTPEGLTESLIALGRTEIGRLEPHDGTALKRFQQTFFTDWKQTLEIELPKPNEVATEFILPFSDESLHASRILIGRPGKGDSVPAIVFQPQYPLASAVLLVSDKGRSEFLNAAGDAPGSLVRTLLASGRTVLLIDTFLTGERSDASVEKRRDIPFGLFFDTYNRTNLQERVQDILTSIAYLRGLPGVHAVELAGFGHAGIWALLAAPAANSVAVDLGNVNLADDNIFLSNDLYAPCLRHLGDVNTASILGAPNPLLIWNAGNSEAALAPIRRVYKAIDRSEVVTIKPGSLNETEIAAWLTSR